MNCPSTEQWDLLSMNLVGQPDEADLLAHAQDCDACRAALRQARRDHARLLRSFEVFERRHDRLREELMATVPHELPRRPEVPRLVRAWHEIGGVLMNLNTANRRLAAVLVPAACILIAVGIFLIPGRSAVAFAAVLERMRQARTMVCDLTTVATTVFEAENRTEEQRYQGKLSRYSDGVTQVSRLDQIDPPTTQWTFPDRMVSIDADGKRTVIRFAERANPYERCESPEWWLSRLLKLTEAPDRELGQQTLDGRKVVGFEIAGWKLGYGVRPTPGVDATTTPTDIMRLWVDASTRLPVRMQVAYVMPMRLGGIFSVKVSQTWEHIEWDVPLDPQSFEPPPPVAGAPVEELVVNATEEGLLNGLRAYAATAERVQALFGGGFTDLLGVLERELPCNGEAQMTRGELARAIREFLHGYPNQLDLGVFARLSFIAPSVSRAKVLAARASGNAEAMARAQEEEKTRHPEEITDLMKKLPGAIAFYSQLLREDREPEYFGATVKPGDSDGVLMRWKLDDRHWRVIYGDLRAETAPPGGEGMPASRPAPALLPSQPGAVQVDGRDTPVPTEEALLDGLRAYAAEIERIKAMFGERFADLPQLIEQHEQELLLDDPEAEQARAFLNSLVEVLGHGYPKQLDTSCLLKLSVIGPNLIRGRELAARARGDAEALARWADEREAAAGNAEAEAQLAERRDRARKEHDELACKMSAMLIFYRQLLLEDREPEYFGATVEPGDADAVLMRWKLDDSHRRVIYGDLRAETVQSDQQTNELP